MSKVILSVESVRYPLTGIGRYTMELGMELQKIYGHNDILFTDGRNVIDNYNFCESSLYRRRNSKIDLLKKYIKKSYVLSNAYFEVKRYMESKALKGYESCILHATNFSCPKFHGKKIVTFHDMSPYITPNCQEEVRLNILKRECENTVRNADALITVSNSSKKDIVEYFGFSSERVFVTPLGCNSYFYSIDKQSVIERLNEIGINYKGYVLFVGTIEPRKNIKTLIKAYEKLNRSIKDHIPLVICGHRGWKSEEIFDEICRGSSEGWIYYLNFVDQKTLLSLYAGAKLFCFPSLYEGFGLPLLEAMASKVPVISSNNSSLPEVLGDAGILIEAEDVDAWATEISSVLESPSLINEMVNKGFSRAKDFSWRRCALDTINVYTAVEKF